MRIRALFPDITDRVLAVLAVAVVLAVIGLIGLKLLPDNEPEPVRQPLVPIATTVDGIPLYLDGEKAGTCELDITPATVSDLRCYDVKAPTP